MKKHNVIAHQIYTRLLTLSRTLRQNMTSPQQGVWDLAVARIIPPEKIDLYTDLRDMPSPSMPTRFNLLLRHLRSLVAGYYDLVRCGETPDGYRSRLEHVERIASNDLRSYCAAQIEAGPPEKWALVLVSERALRTPTTPIVAADDEIWRQWADRPDATFTPPVVEM